jgi:hypothetical protein
MSLASQILQQGKLLLGLYKYSSVEVRNPDGSLNFTDDKMDCSEFVMAATKAASPELFKKLTTKNPAGKPMANTSTIKEAIKNLEGWPDLSHLNTGTPASGDWLIWEGHLEILEQVTQAGRFITLGANGQENGAVPKNIDSKSLASMKTIAAKYLGAWTPNLPTTA